MFSLCENMKWSHLPLPGGIYAQHPKLIEQFRVIFSVRAEHEEKKRKADEQKQRRNSSPGRRGRRR
jgi:hypothetical protein